MPTESTKPGQVPAAESLDLADLVAYGDGAVVSRTLVKSDGGSVTMFAFDAGEGLSEHTAPFDAFVQVLDGSGRFTIGGTPHQVDAGQVILLPADIPHAVHAVTRFRMMLTMLRRGK